MTDADPNRGAQLAAIHIAKAQLGLEEAPYRDLVERFSEGRTRSAGCLTPRERRAMLAHFTTLGWGRSDGVERRFTPARKPQARLVWALWGELKRMGALENPSREAARAFCARAAGIDAATDPDFLDAAQLSNCIEALKSWIAREKAKVR